MPTLSLFQEHHNYLQHANSSKGNLQQEAKQGALKET